MLLGLTVTATPPPVGGPDVMVTVAEADFVGSCTEVAVTVPVPGVTAVYCPVWSTVPTLVAVHLTPMVEFATFATNVCCCPGVRDAVVGDMVTLMLEATRLPIR
jgi:hypothetical protein